MNPDIQYISADEIYEDTTEHFSDENESTPNTATVIHDDSDSDSDFEHADRLSPTYKYNLFGFNHLFVDLPDTFNFNMINNIHTTNTEIISLNREVNHYKSILRFQGIDELMITHIIQLRLNILNNQFAEYLERKYDNTRYTEW